MVVAADNTTAIKTYHATPREVVSKAIEPTSVDFFSREGKHEKSCLPSLEKNSTEVGSMALLTTSLGVA